MKEFTANRCPILLPEQLMTPDKRIVLSRNHSAGNDPQDWSRWLFMENAWVMAAIWVGLALIATLLAIRFRISTAPSEIVVGTVAQLVIGALFVHAELDPQMFRAKWKEATVVGLVGLFGPFLETAKHPKYRSDEHIKISPLYIDFRMNWPPAARGLSTLAGV